MSSIARNRDPIEIMGGAIVIGDLKVDFYSEHMDDVLVAFLEAILVTDILSQLMSN